MHKASILCVPGAIVQKDIKRRCTSPPMYDAPPAHAALIDNMWQLHTSGGTGGSSRSVSWRWQETSRGMTAVLTIKQEHVASKASKKGSTETACHSALLSSVQAVGTSIFSKYANVPCTIVQRLWVFDWKLQIRWLYPHLSKWGSQCYMRKEEDRSSYTNDHRFCLLKDSFSLNLLLSLWPV